MANEIEVIVTGKDKTGPAFNSATRASKEYGKGIEGVGEKSDVAEQRALGLKDTIDGVATIMQGPGQQGIAAYVQGWADLAGGVANFVVPAVQATVAIARANVAATISAAKAKAAAIASRAWAVAQGALNVVMSANPIVLVVLAIGALVAAFVIAYRRSETFRNIVQTVWRVLKEGGRSAISAVLGVVDKFLGGIQMMAHVMGKLPGPLGAPFRAAERAIEGARRKVRQLQDAINDTHGKTVTINVETIRRSYDVGGGSRRLGVGMQAHGGITGAASGGPRGRLTWVGEHEPELIDLPPGTRVRSGPDSRRLAAEAAGNGGTVVLEIRSGGSRLDDLLVELLRKAVRVRGGNVQVALGTG